MDKVSAAEVSEAVAKYDVKSWRLRDCSICYAPLHYLFAGSNVYYQGGCDCSWSPPQPRSYQCVADTLNMQAPEVRDRMWSELIGSQNRVASRS